MDDSQTGSLVKHIGKKKHLMLINHFRLLFVILQPPVKSVMGEIIILIVLSNLTAHMSNMTSVL